jgi:hypothetical protein
MVYLGSKAYFSVNMDRIAAAKVDARRVGPKSGNSTEAGSFINKRTQSFSIPEGWEDAILILESS